MEENIHSYKKVEKEGLVNFHFSFSLRGAYLLLANCLVLFIALAIGAIHKKQFLLIKSGRRILPIIA